MGDEIPKLKTSQSEQRREEENRSVKGVKISLSRISL